MRPLSPFRPQTARRPDPAPSRLAYRLQRLALSHGLRRAFVLGMPALAIAVIGGLTLASPDRRAALHARIDAVRLAIASRDEFMVRTVAIDGASPGVASGITRILSLDLPVSSFDLDLAAMQDRVLSLDAVERADLRVKPGGLLDIRVRERVPALVWRGPDGLDLLDASGNRVAALAARADRADLPLISGLAADRAAAEALALVEAASPLAPRLRGLVRVGERRWDLVLSGGQKIKLPETDPVAALARVIAVDAADDLFAREVVLVDMRLPHRPTVRLKPAAAQMLRQVKLTELGDE